MNKRFLEDFITALTRQIGETRKPVLSSLKDNVPGAVVTDYNYSSDNGRISEELDVEFVDHSRISVVIVRKLCTLEIVFDPSDPDTMQTRTFHLA